MKGFYKLFVLIFVFCSCGSYCFAQKNLQSKYFISGEILGKYLVSGINGGISFQKTDSSKILIKYSIGGWYNPQWYPLYLYKNKVELNTALSISIKNKKNIIGVELGFSKCLKRYYFYDFNSFSLLFDSSIKKINQELTYPLVSLNFCYSSIKRKRMIFKCGVLAAPKTFNSQYGDAFIRPRIGFEFKFNKEKK